MYFDSFSDFIAMGGHGVYIWACYLIVFIALILQFKFAQKVLFKNAKAVDRFYRREQLRAQKKALNSSTTATNIESEKS
ncbi:heme exporter protein CcmD [Aliikangiella sp. IMCC44632]